MRGRAARAVLSAVLVIGGTGCGFLETPAANGTGSSAEPSTLPTVQPDRLPPEAVRTLRLIDAGGPFPHDRDGSVFRNRERRLPVRPARYYREYTVPTPGSADRGARRIVSGDGGERFYTYDHYGSFRRVVWDGARRAAV